MEVVVSFINGDPDNPLVIGAVYNGENKPPYLPGEDTKSTIKSKIVNGEGYNELWFQDKKDQEEIYIHAQKDMNTKVEKDSSLTLIEGNYLIEIKEGNLTIKCNEGDANVTIKGNMSIDCSENFSVKANVISLEAKTSLTAKGQTIELDAKANLTAKAGAAFSAKGEATAELLGGGPTTIKGGGPLSLQGAITEIKGALVKING